MERSGLSFIDHVIVIHPHHDIEVRAFAQWRYRQALFPAKRGRLTAKEARRTRSSQRVWSMIMTDEALLAELPPDLLRDVLV
ncbi:hypothetical protein FOA52_000257 [Chlamydomonas sp. UWO 241]|nr:hypothetical protein FOA52_000257 [Chlamydomonas sp. UWO 241]